MATRTKGGSGLLLVVVLAVVAMTGTGLSVAVDHVEEWIDGIGGAELITAPDVKAQVDKCRRGEDLSDEECDGMRFVVLDAKRMPFIALNIREAWKSGRPGILTRAGNSTIKANRAFACGRFRPAHGGSCDEYPFASSVEGGQGARMAEVPGRENSCQGGTLSGEYRRKGIKVGDAFGVMLRNSDSTAEGPYTGTDIAKEYGCA